MSDEPPNEESPAPPRRRALTPEQRRFLGTPRARDEESQPVDTPPARAPRNREAEERDRAESHRAMPESRWSAPKQPGESDDRVEAGMRHSDRKVVRVPEMQRAVVIIGLLIVLGLTFFVGMKFPSWKYRLITSRKAPDMDGTVPNKFPGVSTDALIEEALSLERAGKYKDAAERLLAAKHKTLGYRGILARVGKIAYDQNDFATADKIFERAIAFGENVDNANYFRGLIAVRRKDLPAALRFFEAAAVAEPFVADYYFYWGETLRLDHRPRESIPRYEHAALLARGEHEAIICRFKIRMALLEAADADKVKGELEAWKSGGKLPVDWLMTAAAIDLREGRLDEAIPFIRLARDGGEPDIFAACATDAYFAAASRKDSRVAEACQLPSG